MRGRRWGWTVVALVALGAAACSSGSTGAPSATSTGRVPSSRLTATEESLSWFAAVNAKDRDASLAHFAPQARDTADWDDGDVSRWPTFTDVRCTPQGVATTTAATVHCTFVSHGDPSSAGDTFWTIDYRRTSGGPWLITNYGQP